MAITVKMDLPPRMFALTVALALPERDGVALAPLGRSPAWTARPGSGAAEAAAERASFCSNRIRQALAAQAWSTGSCNGPTAPDRQSRVLNLAPLGPPPDQRHTERRERAAGRFTQPKQTFKCARRLLAAI